MKKKKMVSKSNKLLIAIEILCILIFIYAAVQLYMIFADYQRASNEYDTLAETVVTEDKEVEKIEEVEKDDIIVSSAVELFGDIVEFE